MTGRPTAAWRSRKAATSSSLSALPRHWLGLLTKTWKLSQPISSARSNAVAMPPDVETCAPMRPMAASLPGGTLRTVLRTVLTQPSPDELVAFLEEALRDKGAVVQVAGEFEVFYTGRAASVAEAGDYLLLVKPDGSVQVHGPRGVKPVNWQPQTDDVRVACEDGSAVLTAARLAPPETLRVGFLAPAFAQSFELRDGGGFVLLGSEAEMQAALASDPSVIEPGLTLVDLEIPTDVGGIDLLARDA